MCAVCRHLFSQTADRTNISNGPGLLFKLLCFGQICLGENLLSLQNPTLEWVVSGGAFLALNAGYKERQAH